MEKEPKINIGLEIKLELVRQGKTVKWLAERIEYNNSSLCKLLKRNHLYNEDLLTKISIALNKDFFSLYTKMLMAKLAK